MKLPIPDSFVRAFIFGSVALLVASGVRFQVQRKVRTSFSTNAYIEDSQAGTGTRVRVAASTNDTAGEYFTVELLIRPQAYGQYKKLPGSQPAHLHLHQQESIEVHEGQLGYWIGNPVHHATAGQGDVVIIQQGEAHSIWNADGGSTGGSELLISVTHTPARHGEALFETLAGLGYDYESVLAVSPLQQLITYYRAEVVLISMSSWAWELVGNILVPFGEGLGYKAFYPEYTSQRTTVTPSDMHTDEE
eukprot:jgi/Chrzof1/4873/Cz15g02130.t1